MDFFISDLHFGHERIIEYCDRPFSSVAEMDQALIENWNKKVGRKDTVYILGDVVWDKNLVGSYMEQLRGKKVLIPGNHDEPWKKKEDCLKYFDRTAEYLLINTGGHPATLCHYPMLEWDRSRVVSHRKTSLHIHGHIHNRIAPEYRPLFLMPNALNAGVDINGYAPVTLPELIENNRRFKLAALDREEDRQLLLALYESYHL